MSLTKSEFFDMPTADYRIHRFPPLAKPVEVDDSFALDDQWHDPQASCSKSCKRVFKRV